MQDQKPAPRRQGRPRILSLDQVLDAACELGLDGLDMSSLAQKLNVGIATLYNYVDDREHLLRLVGIRLSTLHVIEDRGQDWEDALREYAEAIYHSYRLWPQLLTHQANGIVGDPTASQATNVILELLIDRGLKPKEALELWMQATQVVAGAALAATCYDKLCEYAGGEPQLTQRFEATCVENDLSALGRCLKAASLYDVASDYRPTVERLITEVQFRLASCPASSSSAAQVN